MPWRALSCTADVQRFQHAKGAFIHEEGFTRSSITIHPDVLTNTRTTSEKRKDDGDDDDSG